jgi:hypothetical protein
MVSKPLLRFCTWLLADRPYPEADAIEASGSGGANALLADLKQAARQIDLRTFEFSQGDTAAVGYVQLQRWGAELVLHRIWTAVPQQGLGSLILRSLCELADAHNVVLRLKVAPLGAKPYPLSEQQLRNWYHRHGFTGQRKLVRLPVGELNHA